jgi:hypothetical protein
VNTLKEGVFFHVTRLPVSRRIVLVALIFFLALSVLLPPASAAANWYNSCWLYRQNISINHSAVSGAPTDFPVLINISNPNLESSTVQSNGNNILFTTSDGTTKLPPEIENFTQSTGTLVAWVQMSASAGGGGSTAIFKVTRGTPAGTDMTADAHLIGIRIKYTRTVA